jgi:sulfur-carrier protein
MKILYFAKFRQIIGRGNEEITVPSVVLTAGDLVSHLSTIDAGCAAAFSDLRTVKVAINQVHCGLDASLVGANEVAFFPPVTGG